MATDQDIIQHIEKLVAEEHRLLDQAADGGPNAADHERLEKLQLALDQCWDLLRQRRGRRHAGADPNTAQARDPKTVENYEQ